MKIIHGDNDYVSSIVDDTKPDCTFPSLTAYVVGEKARKFLRLTADERRDSFVSTTAKAFNNSQANRVRLLLLLLSLLSRVPFGLI